MATTTFRSRARVIDLLGRQQIADTSTAISELLKNALDASARSVIVNFLKDDDSLIIKDDGLGMRTSDVLDKWLVLATESKNKKFNDVTGWSKYADERQRQWQTLPKYGEKGIGRLSIAALGRVVVLWTVWGKGDDMTGTLCVVHWNLFQHPTKLFEDLPIPYATYKRIPTKEEFDTFLNDFINHDKIQSLLTDQAWEESLRREILHDINAIRNTSALYNSIKWECGTMFLISGLTAGIDDLFCCTEQFDDSENIDFSSVKAYHTFSAFWDPFHNHPDREFKIIPQINSCDIDQTKSFWHPDDFKKVDHHICIQVDANGFAHGALYGYEEEVVLYQRQLPHLARGMQSPGHFTVEIGYLEGDSENSKISRESHKFFNKRLKYAGGFSIYVNNVRIQPYGTTESDFVGFESRRLKNVGRYFFSAARMFGGVFISSTEKTKLKEKAGREGFIVNAASKGLRFWLEELFIDLADSHYGSKAKTKRAPRKNDTLNRKAKVAAEKMERLKRNFISECRTAWKNLRDHQSDIKKLANTTKQLFANALNNAPGTSIDNCVAHHTKLLSILKDIRNTPSCIPPGVIIEDDTLYQIELFLSERTNLIYLLEKTANSGASSLHQLRGRIENTEELEKNLKKRAEESFSEIKSWITKSMEPAIQKSKNISAELKQLIETYLKEVDEAREEILQGTTVADIIKNENGELAKLWEASIQKQYEYYESSLKPRIDRVTESIQNISSETGKIVYFDDLASHYQAIKEENSFLIEMAQIGLVFETSSHEYNSHVDTVRKQIDNLKLNASQENLQFIHELEEAFSIIDERISLYDPLIRRRGKESANITGKDIQNFILRRLNKELINHTLEFTPLCMQYEWRSIKWPVFLGAIYNIVHNAIYWSKKGSVSPKITFSIIDDALTISNTGPEISDTDAIRIFQAGFSRKPYGRGLGLYIAKESLKRIGYTLSYSNLIQGSPSFIITSNQNA